MQVATRMCNFFVINIWTASQQYATNIYENRYNVNLVGKQLPDALSHSRIVCSRKTFDFLGICNLPGALPVPSFAWLSFVSTLKSAVRFNIFTINEPSDICVGKRQKKKKFNFKLSIVETIDFMCTHNDCNKLIGRINKQKGERENKTNLIYHSWPRSAHDPLDQVFQMPLQTQCLRVRVCSVGMRVRYMKVNEKSFVNDHHIGKLL